MLACTYAFNVAIFRESLEGHLFPLFLQVLAMRRMAKIVCSLSAKHLSKERADRLAGIMADQNQKLMVCACGGRRWRLTAGAARERSNAPHSSSLVSGDDAVPIHHTEMLYRRHHWFPARYLSMALTTRSFGRTPTSLRK
jgi:hypothetical protein